LTLEVRGGGRKPLKKIPVSIGCLPEMVWPTGCKDSHLSGGKKKGLKLPNGRASRRHLNGRGVNKCG